MSQTKPQYRIRPKAKEVAERLPEIESIDGRVQKEVARVFVKKIPECFWIARASEDHHPPDERGLGGLWLHTKRVYTAYRMLEPTYRAMSAIDAYEANCARAAVLLHDGFKYGMQPMPDPDREVDDAHPYADGALDHLPEYTQTSHDVDMATFIRDETTLPEEVARCVAAHGGSADWYSHDGPSPSDDLEMLVHTADMLASSKHHRLPVWNPTEELLVMTDTQLPTIDNDEWELYEVDDDGSA
jgi:23S rRNA maturation-related 3'-5' exoribonuclease YhaM